MFVNNSTSSTHSQSLHILFTTDGVSSCIRSHPLFNKITLHKFFRRTYTSDRDLVYRAGVEVTVKPGPSRNDTPDKTHNILQLVVDTGDE